MTKKHNYDNSVSEPSDSDQKFVDHVNSYEGTEVAERVARHIIVTSSPDIPITIRLDDGVVILNQEALRQRGNYDD